MSDKISFWDSDKKIENVLFLMIGLTITFAFIFSLIKEFSNNITLVVEVGVGIIITIIVFRTTKKSELQNKKTLDTIKQKQDLDALEETSRDLEHSIELTEVQILNKKQTELIERIEPILNQQRKIINTSQIVKHEQFQTIALPIIRFFSYSIKLFEIRDLSEQDKRSIVIPESYLDIEANFTYANNGLKNTEYFFTDRSLWIELWNCTLGPIEGRFFEDGTEVTSEQWKKYLPVILSQLTQSYVDSINEKKKLETSLMNI